MIETNTSNQLCSNNLKKKRARIIQGSVNQSKHKNNVSGLKTQKIESGATKTTGKRESQKENGQRDGMPNLVHKLYLTKISGSSKNYVVPDRLKSSSTKDKNWT